MSDEPQAKAAADPLYSQEIIPTLYAKIGVLTTRVELIAQENEILRSHLYEAQERLQKIEDANKKISNPPKE